MADFFGITVNVDMVVAVIFLVGTMIFVADQIHKEQNGKVSGLGR